MCDTYPTFNKRFWAKALRHVLGFALGLLTLACHAGTAWGQAEEAKETHVTTIRGRVLNQVTKEPVGHALVIGSGDSYATITDDRGQFELKIVEQHEKESAQGNVVGSRMTPRFGTRVSLQARRPGFLLPKPVLTRPIEEGQEESATIYLTPEALIVGRVTVAGTEAAGIQCELYRRMIIDGKPSWNPAGMFPAWANGEFRFSGLSAGTYRLITHELTDRDSLALGPGAQMFGYPPVYYPNTTDFSAAAPIVVKAGETAQVNVTATRREYYPVRISVANPPANPGVGVRVYAMGHWGPGWSLGYNPQTQAIEGALPNGNYTVELDTYGEERSTGTVDISVGGRATQGPTMNVVPNVTVSVNVREEFQAQPGDQGVVRFKTNEQQDQPKVQVVLRPIEDSFGGGNVTISQPVEGTQGRTLTLRNVRPGRYRVDVTAFTGYAAVVESDGVDFLKQPLVVGLGGAVPPIEITLRDDAAEMSGVVEGSPAAQGNFQAGGTSPEHYWTVLLLPMERERSRRSYFRTYDGRFFLQALAPGDYLVMAYDEQQGYDDPDLEVEGFLEKAQKFHLEAGEKLTNLRLKVIEEDKGE